MFVCAINKEHLRIIKRDYLCTLNECLVTEIVVDKKVIFSCLYRSPSQTREKFVEFCTDLTLFMSNVIGATKLYFMYYSRVVIVFFSTGLEKSAFSAYSFGFCISMFHFFVFLFLCYFALCFEFNVLIDLIYLI